MTKEHQQGETDRLTVAHVIKLVQQSGFRNYDDGAKWQNDLQTSIRALIAQRLAPVLNQKLAELPQETLKEKQALSCWVNEELRSSGLAIRCPKTGLPAVLRADQGYDTAVGRFQVELISRENGRKRTLNSTTLFPIEITDHPVRIEPGSIGFRKHLQEKRQPGKTRDRS